MIQRYVRSARTGCLLLGWGVLGCGGEPPAPSGEPVQITPAMEKMKEEMFKSYGPSSKTRSPGKSRAAGTASK